MIFEAFLVWAGLMAIVSCMPDKRDARGIHEELQRIRHELQKLSGSSK